MAISMLKIRRPLGRLIFNMGIAIPGKTVFLIETAPWSYRAYQATQTPLFSNPLMSPFDTQVYHECQICLRFHRILTVILEMAFSAHCTLIWMLKWISMTIINKVAWKCIWCCHQVQRFVTLPTVGGNCAVRLERVVKVAPSACAPMWA